MIDDSADKIRRNLVVVSATVVAFWWFDVSIDVVFRRLAGEGVALNQPHKFLASGFALLAYCLARYRFSTDFTSAVLGPWPHTVKRELDKVVDAYMDRARRRFLKTGRLNSIFEADFAKLLNENKEKWRPNLLKGWGYPLLPDKALTEPGSEWIRNYQLDFEWKHLQGTPVKSGAGPTVVATVPTKYRILFRALALFKTLAYSQGSIVSYFPLALAAWAELVLLSRVVALYR